MANDGNSWQTGVLNDFNVLKGIGFDVLRNKLVGQPVIKNITPPPQAAASPVQGDTTPQKTSPLVWVLGGVAAVFAVILLMRK